MDHEQRSDGTGDKVRPRRYTQLDKAAAYDQTIRQAGFFRRLSHRLEIGALRRALQKLKGDLVLDAPCGTGRIHGVISDRFGRVVSLDSSVAMLRVHRDHYRSGDLACGDIFRLPYGDGCFDWVICFRLFHHMQSHADRVAMLRSIARVSRQGVVFSAWVDTPFNRRRGSRRRTLAWREVEAVIREAGMQPAGKVFAAWPFQPKCVITCIPA